MFCFGVGVKDSPSFKISISSQVGGTFDKFNIFMDCGCVIGGSCDSPFFAQLLFLNFLDISIQIIENNLVFDIHYKPTNSFNHLTYTSCHLPHTKNNILLSLAKRIVSIVTNNRENRLRELKEHLLDRKHPQHVIEYSFTKIFQPKFQTENNDSITFIRNYNSNNNINLKTFHSCLDKTKNKELTTCFPKKKVLLSTYKKT